MLTYCLTDVIYILYIYIKYKNDMLHIIIYRLMNKITYRKCKIPKTTRKHTPHTHTCMQISRLFIVKVI